MSWTRRALAAAALLVAAGLVVLSTPQLLFAYQLTHGRFQLWSDRPIDTTAATRVLDDVQRRLARSALDGADQTYRIFICNDDWKLAVYSQRFNSRLGGVADGWLTQNIYLREADLARNEIVPPGSWMYDRSDRPLSYFIAHEATHILEARAFGRLYALRYPTWLVEGYADYVGKGGQFDAADNLRLLRSGASLLDPQASGLYRRYHLALTYLMDHRRLSVRDLFERPPDESEVLRQMEGDVTFPRPEQP